VLVEDGGMGSISFSSAAIGSMCPSRSSTPHFTAAS
jgi:hypothetical protein